MTTFIKILSIISLTLLSTLIHAKKLKFDGCTDAFLKCEFTFKGKKDLPEFDIPYKPDKAFTPDIISKIPKKYIGVVNSNIEGEFIEDDHTKVPFSKAIPAHSGVQPFTPFVFKPYTPSKHGKFSGIGHETFQKGQLPFAKERCVRVFITNYQILDKYGNVIDNVNIDHFKKSKDNCVVFRTR